MEIMPAAVAGRHVFTRSNVAGAAVSPLFFASPAGDEVCSATSWQLSRPCSVCVSPFPPLLFVSGCAGQTHRGERAAPHAAPALRAVEDAVRGATTDQVNPEPEH